MVQQSVKVYFKLSLLVMYLVIIPTTHSSSEESHDHRDEQPSLGNAVGHARCGYSSGFQVEGPEIYYSMKGAFVRAWYTFSLDADAHRVGDSLMVTCMTV